MTHLHAQATADAPAARTPVAPRSASVGGGPMRGRQHPGLQRSAVWAAARLPEPGFGADASRLQATRCVVPCSGFITRPRRPSAKQGSQGQVLFCCCSARLCTLHPLTRPRPVSLSFALFRRQVPAAAAPKAASLPSFACCCYFHYVKPHITCLDSRYGPALPTFSSNLSRTSACALLDAPPCRLCV